MRQDIDTELLLARLHEVHVRQHAVFLERLGELVRDGGGGVQAREGDELEDEAVAGVSGL